MVIIASPRLLVALKHICDGNQALIFIKNTLIHILMEKTQIRTRSQAAERLADLMFENGIRTKALSGTLGVTPQAVSMLVNGVSRPSLILAWKIMKETGVPMHEWFEPTRPRGE
jgi:plasmid maintenance system antidote protein VapI